MGLIDVTMPIPNASPDPSDAAATARILRPSRQCFPGDFAKLDAEAKKRAITVTDEVSLDAIRSMRDAPARQTGRIEYRDSSRPSARQFTRNGALTRHN